MSTLANELRWKKFPVLNDGFVCLVDWMGTDSDIASAARVSYGAGTRSVSDDRGLIRYLMRNRHTSPFEMAEVKLLVRVPMDTWRQWIRHRTASVNEYSTRYSIAIDSAQTTLPSQWRKQATHNKQGSSGEFLDEETGMMLTQEESEHQTLARKVYQHRIELGVAREQARKDLPLSTYTEAYWKCDLHNLFHFLKLRMDSHAQWEIRQYAQIVFDNILKTLFPDSCQAFEDYCLNAVTLSNIEIDWLRRIIKTSQEWGIPLDEAINCVNIIPTDGIGKTEASDAIKKFHRILF